MWVFDLTGNWICFWQKFCKIPVFFQFKLQQRNASSICCAWRLHLPPYSYWCVFLTLKNEIWQLYYLIIQMESLIPFNESLCFLYTVAAWWNETTCLGCESKLVKNVRDCVIHTNLKPSQDPIRTLAPNKIPEWCEFCV